MSAKTSRDREGAGVVQLTGRSMADHIVVFDGTDRLVGQTVQVAVEDASPFTLYGKVLTDEVVGVDVSREPPASATAVKPSRFSLPLA